MKITLHRKFVKKYIKLSPKIKEGFRNRRDLLLKDSRHPQLNNHPLTGDRAGEWSINVTGDWRAIYIWKNSEEIVFIDIDTHSNLYK